MKTAGLKKYLPYLLLLIIAVGGYWQIALLKYSPTFDMMTCFYPWRYFIGECLKNHILPLWNPYQNIGYPIHGDMLTGVWYPVVWITGYLWGYNIYSVSLELILHIYLAGVGMYILGKNMQFNNNVAFFMSVSYMFCGFFIGNAQHLCWIISGTWVPFIISSYISMYKKPNIYHALKTSFFTFMLISGGYTGIAIVLLYFFVSLFIFFVIEYIIHKDFTKLVSFIKCNIISITATALLSAVVIISVLNVIPFLARTEGVTLKQALFCPLSPRCLISFILPFAAIRDMAFFDTDLSMSNIYFGIIPLIFFLISLFIKKPKLMTFFLLWGIFTLSAAMGKYLPVRTFLYEYIPLMNLFRFSSLFRFFSLISFIILAGYALDFYIKTPEKIQKHVKIITIIILLVLLYSILYPIYLGHLNIKEFIKNELFIASVYSNIAQHIFFQGFIQMVFLSSFIFLLIKIKNKSRLSIYITVILIIDIVSAAQLNAPYTVYYHQFRSKSIKEYGTANFVSDFPVPPNKKINEISEEKFLYGPLWKNTNIFNKQIAYNGLSSFSLNKYNLLADNFPDLFHSATDNPPVYMSDKVFPIDSITKHLQKKNINNKNLYLYPTDFRSIKDIRLSHDINDSAFITGFSPDKITVKAISNKVQMLTLLQNNYKGWKAFINNKETAILTSNICFMSVLIPQGESIVTFKYASPSVITGLIITTVSLISVLIFFLFYNYRKK